MQQHKVSVSAHFITLTYDTAHVPITNNGFMSLSKRDIQLFMKRLRKANKKAGNDNKLSYYVCGEYGGKTRRPHYHAIIFNALVETFQDSWQVGQIHYGYDASEAAVGYTLKYMSKGHNRPAHERDDRQTEFSLMSKGLGASYLTPEMVKWHNDDPLNRMYVNLNDGKKVSMPRYYKNKVYDETTRLMAGKSSYEKMQEKINKERLANPDYERTVAQGTAAAFRRQENSQKNRSKV